MAAVTKTGVSASLEIQMMCIISSNETVIMVMMRCAHNRKHILTLKPH